jgi:hypothetical protein
MNNINQFIDERNSELLNSLNSKFSIKIEQSKSREYSCFTQNSEAIIYIDENNICKDSFTHELLHIYLKDKEFFLGASLKLTIAQSRILSRIFSEKLIEHLGNCLDHLKMFEIYKGLGFSQEKFILDYFEYKCTESDIKFLSRNYKIGNKINNNTVDFYIGKLVAIFCDLNIENDYQKHLTILEKLDTKLYSIVEKLIEETKAYNLNNENIFISYRDIANDFYSNLITWIKINKIT